MKKGTETAKGEVGKTRERGKELSYADDLFGKERKMKKTEKERKEEPWLTDTTRINFTY